MTAESEITKLPCDVMLPPNTIIRKGCEFSVLMIAFKARASMPAETDRFFDPPKFGPPNPEHEP